MKNIKKYLFTLFLTLSASAVNAGVLMQAFYWDTPAGGNWYNTVNGKIVDWKNAGITAIWLPPVQKSNNASMSMGYDPYDYFDLGDYNQKGSIETRHGSKAELVSLINKAHANSIQVYADIVINHNSGGESEANPHTNGNTWTKFNHTHNKFNRNFDAYHPNGDKQSDEGVFGGMPDIAHEKAYVQDWLWRRSDSVARYYKDVIGFDGWRFDYVKGFGGWVVKEWTKHVGGFAVGEYWDANRTTLDNWVKASGASVFDFPLYYSMRDAFQGSNMNLLNGAGYAAWNPTKSVTFVANHDTDEIYHNKLLAYVFILTHEGYPTIFYRDYEEWLDKNALKNLIWINENLAKGTTSNLWVDKDTYIAQRNGDKGLAVFINGSNSGHDRTVTTRWKNTTLKDYSGRVSGTRTTNGNGQVTLYAAANNYSVWAPVDVMNNDQWYFSGTPNNWGAWNMVSVGNNNWEMTHHFEANGSFKIRHSNTNWNESYPAQNWNIWQGAGTYKITFNSVSHSISVVKQ